MQQTCKIIQCVKDSTIGSSLLLFDKFAASIPSKQPFNEKPFDDKPLNLRELTFLMLARVHCRKMGKACS